jgi:hypothetical protein
MPATLRTMDIHLVYDEDEERIIMRKVVWAVFVLGLSVSAAGAQSAGNQGQTEDTGQGQTQPKTTDTGGGMDMGHCGGMGRCGGGPSGAAIMQMQGMQGKNLPPLVAGAMRITYAGKLSDWTLAALAALPHKSITVYNEHAKANQTYSGVPLIDLLTKLGVAGQPKGKDLAVYVEAIGTDGYKVVYSAGEINPDVHDGTVLVADSQDGKPIDADGPLKLVAAGEKRPARWVRNLIGVRVLSAE